MLSRRLLRIKVVKALYAHFQSESESLIISEKNLMFSIDKTYDLYHQMLFLFVDVAHFAEQRMELAKQKKLPTKDDLNPNTKLLENAVLIQLEQSEALCDYVKKRSLGWAKYPELIKNLYVTLMESDYFKEYMANPTRSYKEDLKLLENFYLKTINDNEQVESVIEEQSIMWSDDMDFSLIMVVRTLGNCRATQTDIPLLPQYKSDDDRDFAKELFRKTLVNYTEYLGYIERYTQNWDVDRIAFLDNLIMVAAMAELIAFDSIPVKVTMDEFIEIAKYYSTPGSSMFINGVLDKIVESLRAESRIDKTGRGLLERSSVR